MDHYVGINDVAGWVGKSSVWLRFVRNGRQAVHAPFPEPDGMLQRRTQLSPIWSTARRPDVELWYSNYLMLPGKHRKTGAGK